MSATTPIQRAEHVAAQAIPQHLLRIDPLLLLSALGLSCCSCITLYHSGIAGAHGFAEKQAMYAGIGLFAVLLLSRFDYSGVTRLRWALYGLMVVLNLAVFAFPPIANSNSHRSIPLPEFGFQSSEFGKVLLLVTLAAFAIERSRRLSEHRTTARVMLLALVPAMIVMGQSDLGDALVYVVIACGILYFSGTSWKQLGALAALFGVAAAIVLAAAPAVGVNVLQGYQKQRLTTFIDPPAVCNPNTDTTCYQLQQALIAIGSGEKTGRGAAGATQTRFNFIPEAQDDFIFAVVGETYGFAGAAVVLSLYALLIWRTLRIVTMAKNLLGTTIAGGILAMLMFQVFLNIGMAIGIMPVTGVALPLISYGGSSVLTTFLAIGLLQSIHVQARTSSAGKARVLLV